jgi:capsular exopolysaccharide synthesis family protein
VLADQVELTDVLQPWAAGGLTVLTSGTVPPNPSELLGSQPMVELIGKLRGMFDVILIDTPPLLPVTDGAVASAFADGALLVVRYGHAKRHQIGSALNSLRSVDARVLGLVFNAAPNKSVDAYLAYEGYGLEDLDEAATRLRDTVIRRGATDPTDHRRYTAVSNGDAGAGAPPESAVSGTAGDPR